MGMGHEDSNPNKINNENQKRHQDFHMVFKYMF